MSESQQENRDKLGSIPEPIARNKAREQQGMDYIGVLNPVLDQVRTNKSIRQQIEECLTVNPEDLDGMSLSQLDRFLILIPKALIWLQECENLARIAYDDALSAYDDTILFKASRLEKSNFDVSQVSEKMRLALIKEKFPNEYAARSKELRDRKAMLIRADNQTKHLERFNDNIKKIRESHVAKIRNEKDKE